MCGDTVSVTVTVQREIDEDDSGEEKAEGSIGKVICPRYGLEKTEAYWLVIGDSNSNSLLSIKRISIGEKPSKVSSLVMYSHLCTLCFLLSFSHCISYPKSDFFHHHPLPTAHYAFLPFLYNQIFFLLAIFFRQSSSSQHLRILATTIWCYILLVTVTLAVIRNMRSTSLSLLMRMMMHDLTVLL